MMAPLLPQKPLGHITGNWKAFTQWGWRISMHLISKQKASTVIISPSVGEIVKYTNYVEIKKKSLKCNYFSNVSLWLWEYIKGPALWVFMCLIKQNNLLQKSSVTVGSIFGISYWLQGIYLYRYIYLYSRCIKNSWCISNHVFPYWEWRTTVLEQERQQRMRCRFSLHIRIQGWLYWQWKLPSQSWKRAESP